MSRGKHCLAAALESEGIDPFLGECYCVASAMQRIVDPESNHTTVVCIRKEPFGEIAHCMLEDNRNEVYYDASGKYTSEEFIDYIKDFVDECYPYEGMMDEDCIDEHRKPDKFMEKKLCGENPIEKIERIIRKHLPPWLEELKKDLEGRQHLKDHGRSTNPVQ